MAINVYRLQPCLRGRHARRLIFYCSLCYIIWTHLTRFLSYFNPTQLPTLSQAQNNHLFASTIIDKTAENYKQPSLEEIRAQIQDETKNDHFNFTGLIVAVQVHNRPQYFQNLVNSLQNSIGIEHIHLIISSDYWSPEMNKITESIKFCKVTRIFYPLSAAFYSGEFPADSPSDCRRDTTTKCTGKADTYGNYREASVVNIKHHWWWKLNFIRQKFQNFTNLILLEEDHVVTADFIHTIRMMNEAVRRREKNDNYIMTLGTYKSKFSHLTTDWKQLISAQFNSGKHNMGMILSSHLVNKLTSATWAGFFCSFDDYNWDWSLMATITQQQRMIRVYYPLVSRVYHLGDTCGVHHAESNCDGLSAIHRFKSNLFEYRQFLFAPTLNDQIRQMSETKNARKIKPNGGWADERDIRLCQHFQRDTSPKTLLELRRQITAEMVAYIGPV